MVVFLNYCSQNGGNLYRAPYYDRNLNIGPRIDSNLGQSPIEQCSEEGYMPLHYLHCAAVLLRHA